MTPIFVPSTYTAAPAEPRTFSTPSPRWDCESALVRSSTRLTGTTCPISICTVALCAAHPVRVTTIVCLPADSRSTKSGVRPTYAPSTHTSAPSGSEVTNAPPCDGNFSGPANVGAGDDECVAAVDAKTTSSAARKPFMAGRCDLGGECPYAVSSAPIIALVGRPNVGKSSLFNRLVGRRQAIVDATPGVTRDRLYAPVEWTGRMLTVVDTGGIDTGAGPDIVAQTRAQAELALREGDVVG